MDINFKSVMVPGILLVLFFSSVSMLYSANVSVEVQENIDSLVMTNTCVDCNLTGADLNRLNMSGADLRGADLSNATFFLADLSDANLSGAILRGTVFAGADLAGADLRQADLRGVKMAGAYLVGSKFDGSFSEVSVSDDSARLEPIEKTYIPDDSVPKKAPDKQQVNIAERRDFGPVPPQLNPSAGSAAEMKGDSPVDTSAPAKKTSSPPENIVVQHENIEPADKNNKQDLILDQVPKKVKAQTENNSIKSETEKSDLVEVSETDIFVSPEAENAPAGVSDEKEENPPLKEEMAVDNNKEETVPAEPYVSEAEAPVAELEQKVIETDILVSPESKDAAVGSTDEKEENPPLKEEMAVDNKKEETVPVEPHVSEAEAPAGEMAQKVGEDQQLIASETIVEDKKEASPELLNQQKQLKKYKKCYNCNLAGSDFSGENLDSADLEGSDFTGANLEKVDFEDANLKGVSFKNAILKNAKFNGADLYKADFSGADLTGAEFKKALIDETNFQGATGYDSLMLNEPQ
jgi:uncharacterized protein YjbI with pentapeptide repeats